MKKEVTINIYKQKFDFLFTCFLLLSLTSIISFVLLVRPLLATRVYLCVLLKACDPRLCVT